MPRSRRKVRRAPSYRPHKRPEPRPPLTELIALRERMYPGVKRAEFAKMLGVSRLHVVTIEQGRAAVSLELAMRWLELLAPEGKLSMFGPVPLIEERIRAVQTLLKIAPDILQAA